MTGSIALETTYTSETKTGSDSIPSLSLAGLVEIANDDFCEETTTCSSEQQADASKASAPCRGTTDTRRRWQLLCSEPVSVNEDAVSDEDLLAVLLSYLNSTNSRDLATRLITRFETFGNVVSARETQIIDAAPRRVRDHRLLQSHSRCGHTHGA